MYGAVPAQKFWEVGEETLDQGSTPHCVGFGWAGWGNCAPIDDGWMNDDGHAIYYECKAIDGDPKGENGSYVRSGAKAMKNRGRLSAYAFGSLNDARTFVLSQGPAVIGIDWYDGMFYPDASGVIEPTGGYAGGHCVLLYGADDEYAYIQNSWGEGWGISGCCKMRWDALAVAFGRYGEACAAVELELTPPLDPEPEPVPDLYPSWWSRFWSFIKSLFGGG